MEASTSFPAASSPFSAHGPRFLRKWSRPRALYIPLWGHQEEAIAITPLSPPEDARPKPKSDNNSLQNQLKESYFHDTQAQNGKLGNF